MANPAPFLSHLVEAGCSEVTHIHCHDWRALRAAIALHGTNAKAFLKGRTQAVTEFLCTHHDITQAAKIFRVAAPHIPLQKCGCGQKNRGPEFCRQSANNTRVQRIGMINGPHACDQRQPKSSSKAEGVEEGQDAENAVPARDAENLGHPIQVRANIVVRQHHTLGIARTAAGEDDRG